ncbi:hypothetical protein [Micromonospora maritima]|uniref:Lycopene cyclase domain-containing protein n=1 Tax=Micromonospora maritima TaxID=986711 RepID=A0ABW7ZKM5_9ACTN
MRPYRLLAATAVLLALAHLAGSWAAEPLLPVAPPLAWCAAAGVALTVPALSWWVRGGLAVAGFALAALSLPVGERPNFGWTALRTGPVAPRTWLLWALVAVALVVAVAALPVAGPDRRRTLVTVTLLASAVALLMVRDVVTPPYLTAPGLDVVLPPYLVLVGLAVVAVHRSAAVVVAAGLGLAAVALLGVTAALPAFPAPAAGGLTFYSPLEYQARVGGGIWADVLGYAAAALVLVGCVRAHRRAHGAARPRS